MDIPVDIAPECVFRLRVQDILQLDQRQVGGDWEFRHCGKRVKHVLTQGYLVERRSFPKFFTFILDDSTGLLKCFHFSGHLAAAVGDLVRVRGVLTMHKSFVQVKVRGQPRVCEFEEELEWLELTRKYRDSLYTASSVLVPVAPARFSKRIKVFDNDTAVIDLISAVRSMQLTEVHYTQLRELFPTLKEEQVDNSILYLKRIGFLETQGTAESIDDETYVVNQAPFHPRELVVHTLANAPEAVPLAKLEERVYNKFVGLFVNVHLVLNDLLHEDVIYEEEKNHFHLIFKSQPLTYVK